MKKAGGSWTLAVACVSVQVRQKSAQKTRRQMSLILSLVSVLVFWGVPASLAAMTCGAPDSCVVVVDNYKKATTPHMESIITGVDHSCSYLDGAMTSTVLGLPHYVHYVFKYYWDGSNWKLHMPSLYAMGGFSLNADIGADYSNDLDNNRWVTANQVFRNGCSDFPTQQPDQSPNPDPGKPDCPQPPL